jgi:Putative zinc-finger
MSGDATSSSEHRMDCGRVMREEILEGYLAGRLSEDDRDAFEEHYFECARCFRDLQVLRAVRGELQRAGSGLDARTTRSFFGWTAAAAMAAVVVLSVAIVLWMRPPPPSERVERIETQPEVQPQPPEKSGSPRGAEPPSSAGEPSLPQLARFEPPRYEPLRLRGTPSEATTRFQMGMARYQKADYRGAVTHFRSAAELEPAGPHIRFFLGISYLLTGQDRAAVEWLNATIALGDSAYLEDAHFYVAKAYLRQEDLGAAETHLKRVVQLRESRSGEARQLLAQLERLRNRSN